MSTASHPEVWLRGPVPAIPPELTPVARALLQAGEDLDGLASDLTPTELRFEPVRCAMVKCAWLLFLLLVFLRPAFAQTRIRVEFTPDDECAVSTSGAGGRANLRYQRRTTELRCAVPSLSQASSGGEVELEVVLPPGHARPVDAFPRLEWTERDGRWQGTGRLDGVPAFVRIAPDWGFHRFRARVLDAAVILAVGLAIVWSVARGRAS